MEIALMLCLPRDAASVRVIRQVLDGCLDALGATADTRTDIALALGEACANVIQHAGPGAEYEVAAEVTGRRCIVEVVNTGASAAAARAGDGVFPSRGGSSPRGEEVSLPGDEVPLAAEHGRGLKIMDALVDDLQLRSSTRNGTRVHFEKSLRWEPGAAGQHLSGTDR